MWCKRIGLARQPGFNPKHPESVRKATISGERASVAIFASRFPEPADPMMEAFSDPFPALQAALGPQYRLERELGRGGMGAVYRATDTALDRPVASKVVHPEPATHASIARRFLAEARTIARLRHPNIVTVHAAGTAGGLLYYVMDEIDGESLRQRLSRDGQLDFEEAGRFTADLAAALDVAAR